MDCLECKSLEEAFEARLSQYNEARCAAYFRVSTELAAKKNVDMERTRNELEEHQLICASAQAQRLMRTPAGGGLSASVRNSKDFLALSLNDH
jgi:hypothetical protein